MTVAKLPIDPSTKPKKKKKKIYRTYYTETIKSIFKKFIKPLLHHLVPSEDESTLDYGVRRFFHVDTRTVYFMRALRPFTIPGKEWLNGHPRTLGYSGKPRRVDEGGSLVVRIDEFYDPPVVEVEFNEIVFVVEPEQWKIIQRFMEIVA